MKRLILIACLCVAAFVVAPIASASAVEEVTGACTIEGSAEFANPAKKEAFGTAHLNPIVPGPLDYKFTGKANCVTEPLTNPQVVVRGNVTVEGGGELACFLSVSTSTTAPAR